MRALIPLLVGLLVLTGCSSGDEGAGPDAESPSASRLTPSDSLESDGSTSPDGSTEQDTSPSARTAAPRPVFSVVGVAHDDKLNVRRTPSARAKVIGRLAPLARRVEVTGKTRGSWRQVRIGDRVGWVHGRYLAPIGRPVGMTERAREVGIAPTRVSLARKVVASQAPGTEGRLFGPVLVSQRGNRMVVDLLGYQDDALVGERFRLVIRPGEAGFMIRSAAALPICARGVDRNGLCS